MHRSSATVGMPAGSPGPCGTGQDVRCSGATGAGQGIAVDPGSTADPVHPRPACQLRKPARAAAHDRGDGQALRFRQLVTEIRLQRATARAGPPASPGNERRQPTPRHRPGRRTGPGPWPAPPAVTPAPPPSLSAPLTRPHQPVKKIVEDPASAETLVPQDCPDLPQKTDLPRKPAVPGRIMPGWIRQGINPASPYPAAAASPERPPVDPGSAVDPACPSATCQV